MSVETLAPSSPINSTIGSVESAMSPLTATSLPYPKIPPAIEVISLPQGLDSNRSVQDGFRLSELMRLPKHEINIASLNPDRTVPVSEIVFDPRLFEIITSVNSRQSSTTPDETEVFAHHEAVKVQPQLESIRDTLEHPDLRMALSEVFKPIVAEEFPTKEQVKISAETEVLGDETLSSQLEQEQPQVDSLRISLEVLEAEADETALVQAISQVQENPSLTEEEKTMWETKLTNAVSTKSHIETLAEIQAQTQDVQLESTETELPSSTQVSSGEMPPKTPVIVGLEDKGPDQEPTTGQEPVWDVYTIKPTEQVAVDSLHKRLEVAQGILENANNTTNVTPESIAYEEAYKLDVPDIAEAARIVKGDLEYPSITLNAQAALELVKEDDTQAIGRTLVDTVTSNPPKEKVESVTHDGREKQSDLPEPARQLAEQGAKNIIYMERLKEWQAVTELPRKHPWESQKAA